MGACMSAGRAPLLDATDGDMETYRTQFIEDKVLGEGEFGEVKLVHEIGTNQAYACKTLLKGAVFKDNTLYAPMAPEILRGEVEMLRTLAGQHYCLKLRSVYESPRAILLVTECCAGGDMLEYLAMLKEDLRTEDVSRISFQMLDAINHCDQKKVMHRDIKAENVMFISEQPAADLRLIDFGSGTMRHDGPFHTTFCGTPFYSSPELFQKKYTQKTDVWSVGVCLYVMAAGYPADVLQKAFNMLLSSKRGDIKQLPNLPGDLPGPYYEMLDKLLSYNPTKRSSAREILNHPFVRFHQDLKSSSNEDMTADEEEAKDTIMPMKNNLAENRMSRMKSMKLTGSVRRHSLFQDFKKFERALTTLLATMLSRDELRYLLADLARDVDADAKLQAVPVNKLKQALNRHPTIVDMISNLSNAASYESHSYSYSCLEEFCPKEVPGKRQTSVRGNLERKASVWGGLVGGKGSEFLGGDTEVTDVSSSVHSTRSGFGNNKRLARGERDIAKSAHVSRNNVAGMMRMSFRV